MCAPWPLETSKPLQGGVPGTPGTPPLRSGARFGHRHVRGLSGELIAAECDRGRRPGTAGGGDVGVPDVEHLSAVGVTGDGGVAVKRVRTAALDVLVDQGRRPRGRRNPNRTCGAARSVVLDYSTCGREERHGE